MSAIPTPGVPRWPKRLVGLLRRHPVTGFFVLVLGFSWLDVALGVTLRIPGVLTVALVWVGPTFTAVTMAAVLGGRTEVGRLLRGVTIWRVGLRWYMVTLVGIPATPAVRNAGRSRCNS